MSRPVPAALAKLGIAGMSDNLPAGASLDIAKDFVRIFRPEIEQKAFGWQSPFGRDAGTEAANSPITVTGAKRPRTGS